MNDEALQRLEALRSDFQVTVGKPFTHFYCPVLFRDEDTALCRGHLVSEGFVGGDDAWTIQRKDVDEFFGAFFESEFQAIQERGKHHLIDIIRSRKLSRLLRPQILRDGKEVPFYVPKGPVPSAHSQMTLHEGERPTTKLAIKISPSEILASQQAKWEIGFAKDLRLAALVSLLHSAHLTLFNLLGYRYALSASGYFMGSEVLGKFFARNVGKRKKAVLAVAKKHFPEFVNLVRPVVHVPPDMVGTNTDPVLYLCTGKPNAWGFVLFMKVSESMHAIVVPVLEDDEGAARFARFLKQPPPQFEVQLARFKGTEWQVSRNSTMFAWPEANVH